MLRLVRSLRLRRHVTRCRHLTTLAVETSCDDTAVAVLEKNGPRAVLHYNRRLTADNSAHAGIHPLVALESHQQRLATLIQDAIRHIPAKEVEGGKNVPDFVSVTRGPGMRSNLAVGIDTAKGLAVAWGVPLIGVHHMQAHALTPRLVDALKQRPAQDDAERLKPSFPFLSLLVSGGHSLLIQSSSIAEHKILASANGSAAGSCLDKTARAILPKQALAAVPSTAYSALLEKFAFPRGKQDYAYTAPKRTHDDMVNASKPSPYGWPMPMPFLNSRRPNVMEYDFTGINSYAAAIAERGWDSDRQKVSLSPRQTPMPEDEARYLARESFRVCFEHLANRIVLALTGKGGVAAFGKTCKTLVLSGGVAANQFLRHVMREYLSARGFGHIEVVAPPIELCTDNAAMIAWTACEMYESKLSSHNLEFRPFSRWSLENVLHPEREEESRGESELIVEEDARMAKLQAAERAFAANAVNISAKTTASIAINA